MAYFIIVIVFLSFFVLNLFLAVISDSFEQVNQNEEMLEREESKKKEKIIDKMSLFKSQKKPLEKEIQTHLKQQQP